MIGLPGYHGVHSWGEVNGYAQQIGRCASTLDEYVDICREIFTRLKARGAIGMKDQSAYGRTLQFENATREEAEKVFNFFMDDPRRNVGFPASKPLDDYLFHAFMRMARDLDMPVQIHTGHMAGVRNDIAKTNAVHFTSVLELHRDVRFDLFHGNWPYMGEWLYLGKNFPNVALDCCWLHIIDAIYAQNVLAESVTAVPHGKIHGFGGDYGDSVEFAAGHLSIARDNIAVALARLVDSGWLGMDEAKQIAADWLFNNPNRFFRLGFEPVNV
jgi:predicted TIM-barrel fold metal-dependent hydrolase